MHAKQQTLYTWQRAYTGSIIKTSRAARKVILACAFDPNHTKPNQGRRGPGGSMSVRLRKWTINATGGLIMNDKIFIKQRLLGAILLATFFMTPLQIVMAQDDDHGQASNRQVVVNCNKNDSIAKALLSERAERTGVTVKIKGVCHENVVIRTDDVTLMGVTPDAGISGVDPELNTVTIIGASRVLLQTLAISTGRNGVAGVNGAGFEVRECHVHDNANNGIIVTRSSNGLVNNNMVESNGGRGVGIVDGSHATVINNTVRLNGSRGVEVESNSNGRIGLTNRNQPAGNLITANGEEGIEVANGSNAFVYANTITANGQDGLALYQTATTRMMGQNIIEGNSRDGVFLNNGATLFQGRGSEFGGGPNLDIIRGNGRDGIRAFNGSTLQIDEASINGNTGQGIRVDLHANLRLRNSSIENNGGAGIYLRRDAGMLAQETGFGPIVLNGNGGGGVACVDSESSLEVIGIIGPDAISPACTGF